jgi:hypothetical protein
VRSAVQVCPDPPVSEQVDLVSARGAIAQLGERLLCTQEVRSSILLGSTILGWAGAAGKRREKPEASGVLNRQKPRGFKRRNLLLVFLTGKGGK